MADIHALRERAKELRCLYAIDAALAERHQTPARAFARVLEAIPDGWQHPASTGACIAYLGHQYVGPQFAPGGREMSAPLMLWETQIGRIVVSDQYAPPSPDDEPFLPEEDELLRRIAARISEFLEWKHAEMMGMQDPRTKNHWSWRQRFAETLADSIDPVRFGVSRMFIGGSTARGDAGPGSDIDLYIDCHGSPEQRRELSLWLEGWSVCLGEVARQQTGQPFPGGILNVQWLQGEPSVWQLAELQELTLRTPR